MPRYRLDTAVCPACGSSRFKRFEAVASDTTPPRQIRIVECADCVLAWQYPSHRSLDESRRFFEEAYRAAADNPSAYFHPERRAAVAQLQVEAVNQGCDLRGRLLDVGGGNGFFARAASAAGWDVTLVDPALESHSFDGTSIRAHRCTLDGFFDERFDVVTLWDVVEHLPQPTEVVDKAVRLLKPGGSIWIETGNYRSADRVSGGLTHWIYQADHRWYFSPSSIATILSGLSLTHIQVHPAVLRPGWLGQCDFAGPSRAHLLREILLHPAQVAFALRRFAALKSAARWAWAGMIIFAVSARKPRTDLPRCQPSDRTDA